MPTNGIADDILYSIKNAPIYTYGMISIAAFVLACVSYFEDSDEETTVDDSYTQEEPQEEPQEETPQETPQEPPQETPQETPQEPQEEPQEETPDKYTEPQVADNLEENADGSREGEEPRENKSGGKITKTQLSKKKHKTIRKRR
jgi:hypothetical protein